MLEKLENAPWNCLKSAWIWLWKRCKNPASSFSLTQLLGDCGWHNVCSHDKKKKEPHLCFPPGPLERLLSSQVTVDKQWRLLPGIDPNRALSMQKKQMEAKCSVYLSSIGGPLSVMFAKTCKTNVSIPFKMLQYWVHYESFFHRYLASACILMNVHHGLTALQ